MPKLYDVAAEAQDDLFEIWRRIAEDDIGLADRIEGELHDVLHFLAAVHASVTHAGI